MTDDTKTREWPPPMPDRPWVGGLIPSWKMMCDTLTEHWELLRSLREAVCTLMADRHDHRRKAPWAEDLARWFPATVGGSLHDHWESRRAEPASLSDKWREATGCDTPDEARRHLRSWRQEAESSRRDYLECAKERYELRERVRELAVGENGKPLVAELTPVYIAHRLAGDIQGNLSKAARWVAWLAERYYVEPVCPWITLASVWTEERGRVLGLEIDRASIRRCKWFFAVGAEPGLSSGMQVEADAARDAGVSVRNMTGVTGDRFPPGPMAIELFDAKMVAAGIRKRD